MMLCVASCLAFVFGVSALGGPKPCACSRSSQNHGSIFVFNMFAFRPHLTRSRGAATLSLATWEQAAKKPSLLNLAIGQPALSLLPGTAFQSAANGLSSRFDHRQLLQYGAAAGSAHYLDAVATFINANTNLHAPCTSSQLFASPGNSGGLSLAARVLTNPGDAILMEDPSYFLAHQIFRDHHLSLVPVPQLPFATPTGSHGSGTIDLQRLEELLAARAQSAQPMPKLLYLVPTGNNPTGRTMDDSDRALLVALCVSHGITIIADDVYEQLQWAGRHEDGVVPRALRCHAQEQLAPSAVVSLGSWSKILGPGLRLGWVEAEASIIQAFAADGEVVSGSFTSPLVESLVALLVENGDAQAHLSVLRDNLARRAALLADAINREQPADTPPIVHAATAGYFLWVNLQGLDAVQLRSKCELEYDVSFLPGPRCALDVGARDQPAATFGRVCFAFLEEPELIEAGRRLGRAIASERRSTQHRA